MHKLNWYAAFKACREIGGRLAIIQNEEELNKINKRVEELNHYWLGINALVNWFAAFKACRQIGAELAILQNDEELSRINRRIQPRSQYWLGNNFLTNKGRNRIFPFKKPVFFGDWWYNGMLSEDGQGCLVLYESKLWDTECEKKHNYICEAVFED
ncbi:uncharacterized protein Dana_GF15344 [Drosophila ananassae]|uniref:C-type lectin domain-containing protein n=1 Tax=Drosophila ananassae TaxID=7217 RepID=A0A0P8Y3L4_DROAN|nr:uncharacterized protein Dana_GF15344 [Drosophila ananassae]